MSEKLLDRSKIHSSLQKMGGECVTQRVRVEMVEICAAADGVVELSADRSVAEAASALVDKKRVSLVGNASPPTGALGKIGLDGLGRRAAEWYEALFAPLATHPDHSLADLDVTEVKSHELPDAKPRGIKQLHHRTVAAPGGRVRKPLEELLDNVAIGNLRRSLDVVGVGHRICRARLESPLGNQEAEVGPQGGQGASDRSGLKTARMEVCEKGAHCHGRALPGLFVVEFRDDKIDKADDLAAVGAEGRGREVALPLEVLQEWVDQPGSEVAMSSSSTHFRAFGMGASFARAFHHHSRSESPNISLECLIAITLDAST